MGTSPAVASGQLVKLSIFSNGTDISASVQLVSVSVKKAVNRIPVAELVVLDGDMPQQDFPLSNSDHFKPGSEIKISAGYGSSESAIFEGVVIKHGLKIDGDNYSRLVIECRDKAVAMTIGRRNANYIDSKDSGIFSKLIGNYSGLSSAIDATQTQYKELVQYYCTDWDFMLSRAEINGLLVVVDAAKVTIQAPDTSKKPKLTVTYGVDLIDFHASLDARSQLKKVESVGWSLADQTVVQQQAAPQTLNSQGNLDSATLAKVIGLDSFRLQTPTPLDSGSLESWAKAQQVKAGLARIQGRMRFQGSVDAKPGELIELVGVGERFNGKVFVSSVQHGVKDGNWVTEVEFGLKPEWFAESHALHAPAASGLLPGVAGLHVGVVKKLDADPDGQYKVQVSTPVTQAETDGVWARLAGFYASNGFGAFFVPEIGDEVVLGYFNQDPSHPVILGSVYSSKRKPAYEMTADNYKKAVVTRSKLKLEFDDEKKIVTIVTPAKNTIVISDDGKSILLQDQTGNKAQLSESGILLDSPKDITINAKGKVAITATGNVEVDSKADFKLTAMNVNQTAQVGFTAKGSASAEVSASGQTTIKGAMVMIN